MSNKVIIELKPEELIQLNEVLRIADKDFEFCKYDPDSAHEYAVAIMQARNILNMPKGRGHVVRPDLREPVAEAAEPDATEPRDGCSSQYLQLNNEELLSEYRFAANMLTDAADDSDAIPKLRKQMKLMLQEIRNRGILGK